MGSVLAIVSKAVFEKLSKQHGGAEVGTVLPLDAYASTHKSLAPLADGGALFLVTVRPPDERLWLVACLEAPQLGKAGWTATPNRAPIADITTIKDQLVFTTGTGIQAKPGALGMSLQTPRALTSDDEALLRSTVGAGATKAAPTTARTRSKSKAAPAARTKPQTKAAAPAELATIAAALDADDPVAALVAALEVWRATRAPELADLIDAIADQLEAPAIEDEAAFAAAAGTRDPAVVNALLAAIPELPVSFLPQAAAHLAELPLDPRIAMAVATWSTDPPTTSSSAYPFWTRMLDYAGRAGDARTLPKLGKALRTRGTGQFWPKFHKGLERLKTAIGAVDRTPVDEKQVARLSKAVARLDVVQISASSSAASRVESPDAAIAAAITHLAGGRVDAAIEQLLVAWRATRVPALADAIDRATRLSPWYQAPLGVEPKELHAAWMDAFAADPIGRMPQLLDVLNVGGPTMAEQRLTKLATLAGDDPRISLRLAELSIDDADRMSPERTQYWKSLFELIARQRDVRVCAPLRQQFRDFAGRYFDHHRQARRIVGDFVLHPEQAFGGRLPALAGGARDQLAKLEQALATAEAKHGRAEQDLLSAIHDEWASEGPRLVYADWLSEREHPRGELIVLACKGSRTAAEERRYQLLAAAPLWGCLRNLGKLELDRGIPTQLRTFFDTSTLTWRALAGSPVVALMETIVFHDSYAWVPEPADVARLLLDPRLLRLRSFEDVPKELLSAVAPMVASRFAAKGTTLVRTRG